MFDFPRQSVSVPYQVFICLKIRDSWETVKTPIVWDLSYMQKPGVSRDNSTVLSQISIVWATGHISQLHVKEPQEIGSSYALYLGLL